MGSALSHQQQHQPLTEHEVATIAQDTGLAKPTVRRLYRRYRQLCRRGNSSSRKPHHQHHQQDPPHQQQMLLSRRQMMSDPELSANPLGARIVCALYPRGAESLAFPAFCAAMAVFQPALSPAGREAKLRFVYRMLDIEESDFLSLGELCSLLHMLVGNHLPLEQIQSIACRALSEVDLARDNRISFQEFLGAMEGLDIEQKMAVHF